MKRTLFLVALSCNFLFANAQALFQKYYGDTASDIAYSHQITSDGNIIFTGTTGSSGAGGVDVMLVKTTFNGDTLWAKTYGGDGSDEGMNVLETKDKGFLITGYTTSFGFGDYDGYVIKTDANGTLLWSKTYGDEFMNYFQSAIQDDKNGFVLAGTTVDVDYYYDCYVVHIDSIGNIIWSKKYGTLVNDEEALSVYKYYNNTDQIWYYTITGNLYNYVTDAYDVIAYQIDPSGIVVWSKSYGGDYDDKAYNITGIQDDYSGDEFLVVSGSTSSFAVFDNLAASIEAYTIVLNTDGDTINTRAWGNTGDDIIYSAVLTQEGSDIFITSAGTAFNDILLNKSNLKTDAETPVLWSILFGTSTGNDVAYSNLIYNKNMILAGSTSSFGKGSNDAFLLKTNMQGYADGINSSVLYTPKVPTATVITNQNFFEQDNGFVQSCTTESEPFELKSKTIHESIQPYVKVLGGIDDDNANSIETTNDGGIILAGSSYSFLNGDAPFIVKTDNDFNIEWAKGIKMGESWGTINTIKQLDNDDYLYLGSKGSYNAMIGKLNSAGDVKWSKSFSTTDTSLVGLKILTTNSNYYFINKFTYNYSTSGLLLVKSDTSGNIVWNKSITFPNYLNDENNIMIHAANNGDFYVSSNIEIDYSGMGVFVIKFNEDGDTLWTKTYWNNASLYKSRTCSTPDGGVLVCSNTYDDNSSTINLSLLKLDSTGTLQWKKTFGNDNEINVKDVSATSNKGFIITTLYNDFPALIKLDSAGNIDWSLYYTGNDFNVELISAKETSDGGFALLGLNSSFGNGLQDVIVIKADQYCRSILCVNNNFRLDSIKDNIVEYSFEFVIDSMSLTLTSLSDSAETIEPAIVDYTCSTSALAESKFQRTLGNSQFYLESANFSETENGGLMIAYTMNDNKACVAKLNPDLKTLDWARTYNQTTTNANDVIETSHGIYFLANDKSIGGSYLVKLNNQGDTIWTKAYNEHGKFYSIINTLNNNLVLIGKSTDTDSSYYSNLILVKVNQSGDIIWSKIIGDYGNGVGYSVKETSDGGFIIGGSTQSNSYYGYQDAFIIKTDKIGNVEWHKIIGVDEREDVCYSIIETADKGYMFTGYTNTFSVNYSNQLYIVRLDHTGEEVWSEVFFSYAEGNKIIQTSDGNYLIGGTFDSQLIMMKINDNGCVIWTKLFGGTEDNVLSSILQSADGGYYALGHTSSFATRFELYLIKTDRDGNTGECHESSISNIETVPVTFYQNELPVLSRLDTLNVTSPEMKNKNKTTTFTARNVNMNIELDSTWVKCFGESNGSATLTVAGGIAPYKYEWSNNATTQSLSNIKAAEYSVTVTDKYACAISKSIEVPQPNELKLDTVIKQITCYGSQNGYIQVTPNGGNAPYRYAWNTGSSNDFLGSLMPNDYSVNVFDNKGCMVTGQYTIVQPSPITVEFATKNITCTQTNGTISIDAKGGTGALSYLWSNNKTTASLTGIDKGTYTVTITDNNKCEKIDSTIVNIDTYPPTLCLVTVGDSTNNNIIAWPKENNSSIKEYNVYKKSHYNDKFEKIGIVAQGYETQFVDKMSNSLVHSDWYGISVLDVCGNESDMSLPHKTMHLTSNQGLGNTVNLIWERYEGLTFTSYIILRGTHKDTLKEIDRVNYAITTYTDIKPPQGNQVYYNIAFDLQSQCNTSKATEKGPYTMSRSNVEDAGVIDSPNGAGIATIDNTINNVSIQPNPFTESFRLNYTLQSAQETIQIDVLDLVGHSIMNMNVGQQQLGKYSQELNLTKLVTGVYILKITTNNGTLTQRIIKVD